MLIILGFFEKLWVNHHETHKLEKVALWRIINRISIKNCGGKIGYLISRGVMGKIWIFYFGERGVLKERHNRIWKMLKNKIKKLNLRSINKEKLKIYGLFFRGRMGQPFPLRTSKHCPAWYGNIYSRFIITLWHFY